MISVRSSAIFAILFSAYCGVVFGQNDYEAFIDPYSVDNTFHLECGNETNIQMNILFRGDAYKVFAANNASCLAKEVEPGHFEIVDAMNEPACTPRKNANLNLYSLELVIQKGLVRQYDDPTHIVTCNYEMGGKQSSKSQKTSDRDVVRLAVFQQANDGANSSAVMSMVVKDAKGATVKTAYIGSYIQIQMDMESIVNQEESFRPWNCKATATDVDGTEHIHWFLLRGCGEGDVIKRDRGFLTESNLMNNSDILTSRSKSVFFRAFSLTNVGTVQFTCNYIVKADDSALGASCSKSPLFNSRRKRSAGLEETGANNHLPFIESEEILVIPAPPNRLDVLEKSRPVMSKVSDSMPSYGFSSSNRGMLDAMTSSRKTLEEAVKMSSYMKQDSEMLKQPLVIGLIIGICLAIVFLIAVSTLSIYLCCRLMATGRDPYSYRQCYAQDCSPIVKSPPPTYNQQA